MENGIKTTIYMTLNFCVLGYMAFPLLEPLCGWFYKEFCPGRWEVIFFPISICVEKIKESYHYTQWLRWMIFLQDSWFVRVILNVHIVCINLITSYNPPSQRRGILSLDFAVFCFVWLEQAVAKTWELVWVYGVFVLVTFSNNLTCTSLPHLQSD